MQANTQSAYTLSLLYIMSSHFRSTIIVTWCCTRQGRPFPADYAGSSSSWRRSSSRTWAPTAVMETRSLPAWPAANRSPCSWSWRPTLTPTGSHHHTSVACAGSCLRSSVTFGSTWSVTLHEPWSRGSRLRLLGHRQILVSSCFFFFWVLFFLFLSSLQFQMESVCLAKAICALSCLSDFPNHSNVHLIFKCPRWNLCSWKRPYMCSPSCLGFP